MRFKPRDRTAYFEWLKKNEANFLAEATAQSARSSRASQNCRTVSAASTASAIG